MRSYAGREGQRKEDTLAVSHEKRERENEVVRRTRGSKDPRPPCSHAQEEREMRSYAEPEGQRTQDPLAVIPKKREKGKRARNRSGHPPQTTLQSFSTRQSNQGGF